MNFNKTIPILRIFSPEKAEEFYIGYLGFTVDWQHRFEEGAPLYMQVSKGDLTLHLTEHHGDCCPGGTVFVATSDLDTFYEELAAKEYRHLNPSIEDAPWGDRLLEVIDPFGNRLRFNEAR